MNPDRIISGGQTGADQAALFAARALGILTGGVAPRGWRTEDGAAPWLAIYGLVECSDASYRSRTVLNVTGSTGTVIFGNVESAGSKLTISTCRREDKPCLVNPSDGDVLRDWCDFHDIVVMNVAGNRASTNPAIGDTVVRVLGEAFGCQCNPVFMAVLPTRPRHSNRSECQRP